MTGGDPWAERPGHRPTFGDAPGSTPTASGRRWAARLAGPVILAAIAVLRAFVVDGRVVGTATAVVIVGALGGTFLGIAAVDRRRRNRAAPDEVFATFGRFVLDELVALPAVAIAVAGVKPSKIEDFARGWVEGTVAFAPEELRFRPGNLAKTAGVAPFGLRWDTMGAIRAQTQPRTLGVGLEIEFRDGRKVSAEARNERGVRNALTTVLRT